MNKHPGAAADEAGLRGAWLWTCAACPARRRKGPRLHARSSDVDRDVPCDARGDVDLAVAAVVVVVLFLIVPDETHVADLDPDGRRRGFTVPLARPDVPPYDPRSRVRAL